MDELRETLKAKAFDNVRINSTYSLSPDEALAVFKEWLRDSADSRNTLLLNMMHGVIPRIHPWALYKLYTLEELQEAHSMATPTKDTDT